MICNEMAPKGGKRGSASRLTRFLLGGMALFILGGCAGTTTFTSYTKKMSLHLQDLQSRKPIDFTQCLLSECQSMDQILYTMERGRMAQIIGQAEVSKKDFGATMEAIKVNEEKATVSASGIGAQAAAVMVNDNAIPYEGEGYERVMLHHFQAMNHLVNKDVEGAAVEVRRANAEQEEALKRHEKELEKARAEAEEKELNPEEASTGVASRFEVLDEVAGKVKNSFQNAYTFYMSGLVYELMNQPNDAYIDYKKALEIFPDNSYLKRDVGRLAHSLGMTEEQEALRERFGAELLSGAGSVKGGDGDLVVLYEDGFVPQKKEIKIPIPVPRAGLVAVAFPIYNEKWSDCAPLTVARPDGEIGATEPICYLNALAVKALKEKVPAIAIRQTIRAAAKAATAAVAKEHLGSLGSLTASIYNLVSENADLRSWVTLPANAQIMRATLPAGIHRLTVAQKGSNVSAPVEVEIREGGKTFLRVIRTGEQLYSSSVTF